MKIAMLGLVAALAAVPAFATKEFDCPPGQEVQSQRNETVVSEDLLQKRRQAREAEIARLKERLMRAAPAQPVAVAEQPAPR